MTVPCLCLREMRSASNSVSLTWDTKDTNPHHKGFHRPWDMRHKDKLTCCLRTLTHGQRYEEVVREEPREEAHSETLKAIVSVIQRVRTLQLNVTEKQHSLVSIFFKAGVWIMRFNCCFSLKHWLWLYDCVCARACCIPLCGIVRQAICPFYKMSCIHGDSCLQQIPFLGSFF